MWGWSVLRRDNRPTEDLGVFLEAGAQSTPFTAQHLRVTLAQVEADVKRLERRLGTVLSASVDKARTRSLQDPARVVASQEREFKDAGGRIEHEVLRRFTADQGLLLHEHSIQRHGRDVVNRIQRELVVGVARGQTWRQIAKRLTDKENSVLAGMRSRGELIVRMELNGAYNDAHLTSIREAGRVLDEAHPGDPLLKKADEFFDLRNHALSRVLDGQVQPADQPFKVSVARVHAEHEALQAERARRRLPPRRLTGILWEQVSGDYVGMNYPSHFWERGRIVPWRKSWGEDGSSVLMASKKVESRDQPTTPVQRGIVTTRSKAHRDVLADIKAVGGRVVGGSEAEKYLDWRAAGLGISPESLHAVTIDDTIFIRKRYRRDPRVLREEWIHLRQQAAGITVDATGEGVAAAEAAARREISANADLWGLTDKELDEVVKEEEIISRTKVY